MLLNTLSPAPGSKKDAKRVGRGIGCGTGKTCGRGHKGQKARNKVPAGFEGGQMPFHRRVPKFGFSSRKALVTAEVPLMRLEGLGETTIDLDTLKKHNLVNNRMKFVSIIAAGEIKSAFTIKGLRVTKGARQAIEAAGGKVEA